MKKRLIIPTLVVGLLGGYTFAQSDVINTAEAQSATITAKQAKNIALKKFNGTITEFEYDSDDKVPHYEIEIHTKTEEIDVEVNAINGKLTVKDRDPLKKNTINKKNLITEKQAIAIAKKKVNGTVENIELDKDDNKYVYEIEIHKGKYEYDFEINARTGKIIDLDKDYIEKYDDDDFDDDDD